MQITKRFLQYCLHRTRRWIFFLHSGCAFLYLGAEERAVLCCPLWTGLLRFLRSPISLFLTDLLQQLLLDQFELHAHRHLGDELLAAFLGHLFAVSQVNVTDASTALEIGQRLVCDPVTDCGGGKQTM